MEKTFSLQEITEDKPQLLQRHSYCILNFQILPSLRSQVAVYLVNAELVKCPVPQKVQDLPVPAHQVKAYLRGKQILKLFTCQICHVLLEYCYSYQKMMFSAQLSQLLET